MNGMELKIDRIMKNNIRNIVFDFDGTLVDTAPLIVATMQAAIERLGLAPKTEAECRATIGLRLEEIPKVLWPGNEVAEREFATTYRRIFDELKRPLSVTLFPGVAATLDDFHRRGLRMAIASSRSRASLEEYVAMFGMADYFEMLVGGNDVTHGKPSAEPVKKILAACGWRPEETLTVGDANVDILMGRAAGTLTCAVSYGNGTREQLEAAAPTYIVDAFDRLASIVG